MSDPLIGARLGNYQIESSLGRGGMARVYRAVDVTLRRVVALKVIEPDLRDLGSYSARFEREAQAIAALEHPNIVPVYYFGEADGLYYMAMKFIEGVELRVLIDLYEQAGQSLPTADLLRIYEAVGSALDYAHSQGVIHRDVKPSNIMIDRNGQAYLTDFGLALNVGQGTMGEVFGTPHYIAPEQARSSANAVPESDFYSLGVILYELFTGTVPFDDPVPTAVALQHIMKEPTPPHVINPDLPPSLEMVIMKAIAKDPAERYQTGEALSSALRRAVRGMTGAVREGPPVVERVRTILEQEKPPPDINAAYAGSTPHVPTDEIFTRAPSQVRPRRRWRLVLTALVFAVLLTVGYIGAQQFGLFSNRPLLSVAQLPSETPTNAPTATPLVVTATIAANPVSPTTAAPTLTRTPTATPRPLVNVTETLALATMVADLQTATARACDYDYEIVIQEPPEDEPVRAGTEFLRLITFRNTGTCPWEPNTFLTFIDGESFDAGPNITIRQRIDVDEEYELEFAGRAPSAGGGLLVGTWELRTPGGRLIGEPLQINVNTFGGG
jgi:serine/threonine protein kinase